MASITTNYIMCSSLNYTVQYVTNNCDMTITCLIKSCLMLLGLLILPGC